jgi:hypothetical protein
MERNIYAVDCVSENMNFDLIAPEAGLKLLNFNNQAVVKCTNRR